MWNGTERGGRPFYDICLTVKCLGSDTRVGFFVPILMLLVSITRTVEGDSLERWKIPDCTDK